MSKKVKIRKVTINVTKNDILSGKRGCMHRCPIAQAALRKFKTVTVKDYIVLNRKQYALPDNAVTFIEAYDDSDDYTRHQMEPFKFSLQIRE